MNFRLSVREFEKRYKSEKDSRAKTRLHILFLRRRNQTQKNISELLSVSQGTVSNVCARFLERGFDSVYDRPRSGKPSRLSARQKSALRARLSKEYFDGNIHRGWQTKDVAQFIQKKFGVTYTMRAIRNLLHEFELSWKVPRPMHLNRDPKAVFRFKKSSNKKFYLWQMNIK